MSNPVAPPPPEGYPPSQGQPYGVPPAQDQLYGALPPQHYGAPPPPGQPPFGPPPGPPGTAPPRRKGGAGKIVLRVLGSLALVVALVAVVAILIVRKLIFADEARDAAVGDCIASSAEVKIDEETKAQAQVVDCASAEAAFTVVGRIEGESDPKSKSCEKFFKENEEYYVYSSATGGGYLLCLSPRSK